jgi:hypothetical protein
MSTMTAKQLAARVAGTAGDEDLIFRRVRYWTVEGLLVPSGELNPGHGRKRFYNQSAVIKASALNRLTDAGVSIVILRVAATFMDTPEFDRLSSKYGPLFLSIKKFQNKDDPDISLYGTNDPEQPVYSDAEYLILVKLG